MSDADSRVIRALLIRGLDDWISAADVARQSGESGMELLEYCIRLTCQLLEDGLIVAGDAGTGFEQSKLPASEVARRVEERWRAHGTAFVLPAGVGWFDLTDTGNEAAEVVASTAM